MITSVTRFLSSLNRKTRQFPVKDATVWNSSSTDGTSSRVMSNNEPSNAQLWRKVDYSFCHATITHTWLEFISQHCPNNKANYWKTLRRNGISVFRSETSDLLLVIAENRRMIKTQSPWWTRWIQSVSQYSLRWNSLREVEAAFLTNTHTEKGCLLCLTA